MPANSPTPERQRLVHLDILRGFALFGILLVNFQWFSRPLQAVYSGPETSLAGADLVVNWAIVWLAEGKFYPLFAMLFGMGFTLMAERSSRAGPGFGRVYSRRLAILALIGLLHLAFVWAGDILLLYAICAVFMLLFFRRTPVSRLWKWGLGLIGLPLVLIAITLLAVSLDPGFAAEMHEEALQEKAGLLIAIEQSGNVYRHGSFIEVSQLRLSEYAEHLTVNGFLLACMVTGYFLLGRWLVASGRVIDLPAYRHFLRRWSRVGLPVGLVLAGTACWYLYHGDMMVYDRAALLGSLLSLLAGVVLPLGYLATVILLSHRLSWLAPVGRMALSQYLLQSLVWTTVFYGYGLGLWGQVPRLWHPLLVLVFFALQVALSHWWLKHFYFGPIEWLWRSLTYWQPQAFRKTSPPAA